MTIERAIIIWAGNKAGVDAASVTSVSFESESGVGCETCGDYWTTHTIYLHGDDGRVLGEVEVDDLIEVIQGADAIMET